MQLPLKPSRVTASAVFPAGFMDATIKLKKKKRKVCVLRVLVLKHLTTSRRLHAGTGSGGADQLRAGGKPSLAKPRKLLKREIRHA